MATIGLPLFYDSLAKTTAGIFSEIARNLQNEFQCFTQWKRRAPVPPPEKPKIGTRELSREALAKKEFFGVINKIAPQNKDSILKKLSFRDEFLEVYIKLLWEAFLRSPEYQELYIEVLGVIASHFPRASVCECIERTLWLDYIQERRWLFSAGAAVGEGYDDFCDDVKLKKHIIASINAWALMSKYRYINIIDKLFDMLYTECDSRLKSLDFSKTVEVLLESLYEFVTRFKHPRAISIITHTIKNKWAAIVKDPDCPPVIRFKIYDFNDALK